jgi:2-polyprenyl-3-methyl-5-hydroxy-6-metoxy-1,4-benzoquinol methylase
MTRSFPEQDGPLPRCRICRGELELACTGTAGAHDGAAFAPSCHAPGAHGDLFRCGECGTVQQPSLPRGAALHELYRDMRDDDYLAEEAGRRETARRLLDLLSGQVASGRLLDVGCGHGLLLDEARRRGYEVEGLELSRDAARHARERLDLGVREQPLEDAALDDERYDAIVLTDVLEHLEDPVAALARCTRLLAPGGALLVVTPDPASLTARLAGRRWWGYLPAHLCLVPRATLRELMTAGGLVLAHDVPFVRSFSAGYWLRGLGERGGRLGRALDAVARRLPATASLSLSLGDERVVVATRTPVTRPERPVARDRGAPAAVHAVLPAYKAERTIARVAEALPTDALDRALLVDDASPDGTRAAALAAGLEVLVHPVNRGYGANQKTCYVRAALDGADVVVMVHGDNQYDPSLVAEMVKPIEDGRADVVIGSRLLQDETIAGGMPRWKWVGNRALTWVENRAFRRSFSEYHTGYRAFSVDFLRTIAFLRNDDGFVFDQEIFAQIVAADARVVELAIPTRYFLEASSVSFSRSVEYGLRTLAVLARFRLDERRGRWLLLRRPATDLRGLADEAQPAATSPW